MASTCSRPPRSLLISPLPKTDANKIAMAEKVFHTLLGGAIAPSQIENETSAPEVAAWARANNLSRMDCLTLLQKRYNGRALLRVCEHQLRLDGLSAEGAAALLDSDSGLPLGPSSRPRTVPCPTPLSW